MRLDRADAPTEGHVHKFGPLQFGKQLGPAHYEGVHDPCPCGLTYETWLKDVFRQLRDQADAWKTAMAAEGVAEHTIERVVNRCMWGNPDGLFAHDKPTGDGQPPLTPLIDEEVALLDQMLGAQLWVMEENVGEAHPWRGPSRYEVEQQRAAVAKWRRLYGRT